jgi:hypothetical protein
MDWTTIKNKIIEELNSKERDLARPSIRMGALNRIEERLDNEIIANPKILNTIGKKTLVDSLSKIKKLNGAEKSVVNHIYDVLNGRQIPMRKRKP